MAHLHGKVEQATQNNGLHAAPVRE